MTRHTIHGPFGDYLANLNSWIQTREGHLLRTNVGHDYTSLGLKMFGDLEPSTKKFILNNIDQNGVFLDVGANVGYFSLLVGSQHPQAKVLALEPNPSIACLLQQTIEKSALQSRVSLHQCAAADTAGTLGFGVDPNNSGHSRLSNHSHAAMFEVAVVKLDDWLPERLEGRPLQLVKIDVEGAELKVLRGMELLLKGHRPALVVEGYDSHLKEFGDSLAELKTYLKDLGYREEPTTHANLHLRHRDNS